MLFALLTQSSKANDFEKALSKTIIDKFRVQGALFVNSSLSCSSPSLTFTSTLVYSSDDGSLTATDLINTLLTSTENANITVDGVQLRVHKDEAIAVTSPFSSIGLFFGGFFTSSLILIIVIIILIL